MGTGLSDGADQRSRQVARQVGLRDVVRGLWERGGGGWRGSARSVGVVGERGG